VRAAVRRSARPDIELHERASLEIEDGRGAIGDALAAASRVLVGGRFRAVLIGMIDSLADGESIAALAASDRLLSSDTEGLLPGEGAVFVLAALDDSEVIHNLDARTASQAMRVLAWSSADERHPLGSGKPQRAEGLSAAFRDLRRQLPGYRRRSGPARNR